MRAVIFCFTAALLQAQPINPTFATYFGGGGYEIPGSVTTDRDGNIYIAGRTDSQDFPVLNALQPESRAFSHLARAAHRDLQALAFESAIDNYTRVLDFARRDLQPDLALEAEEPGPKGFFGRLTSRLLG